MTGVQVEISAEDLAYIRGVLNSGTDLYRGYDRILEYLEDEPGLEFWFEGATIINQQANGVPLPTSNNLSSTYVISHTGYGLALDGISVDVTNTSNQIAANVLRDILDNGGVPPLAVFVPQDAMSATSSSIGKQTIGGWGGSFYYWDLVIDDVNNLTVGDKILADGGELEKFILSSAVATLSTFSQEFNENVSYGEILNILTVAGEAALNTSLPLQIAEQIALIVFEGATTGQLITASTSTVYGDWTFNPESGEFTKTVNGEQVVASGSERAFLIERFDYRANVEQQNLNNLESVLSNTAIVGTPNEYTVIEGSDGIFSFFGADTITGTDGNDAIFGYSGDDVVFAGNGDDYVRGASDEDELHGQGDNDQLFGGGENDALVGGAGEDTLHGGTGDDILFTGSAPLDSDGRVDFGGVFGFFEDTPEEILSASTDEANDVAFGGSGDDTFYSTGGRDLLVGGEGDDKFYIQSAGFDDGGDPDAPQGEEPPQTGTLLWGGEGADEFHFYGAAEIAVVYLDGLDGSDWPSVDLDKLSDHLEGYLGEIGSLYTHILINPDENDKLFIDGVQFTNGSVEKVDVEETRDLTILEYAEDAGASNTFNAHIIQELVTEYDVHVANVGANKEFYITGYAEFDDDGFNTLGLGVSETGYTPDGEEFVFNALQISPSSDLFDTRFVLSGFTEGLFGVSFGSNPELVVDETYITYDSILGLSNTIEYETRVVNGVKGRYQVLDEVPDGATIDTSNTFETRQQLLGDDYNSAQRFEFNINDFLIVEEPGEPIPVIDIDPITTDGIPSDEIIDGGLGNDNLFGAGGDDTINGLGGDDRIEGGSGHDTLNGNEGIDTILGGTGDDIISGGQGNDELNGEGSDDIIHGGEGNDFIIGGSGHDTLNGDDGIDFIYGGTGNDIISGGSGNDELFGEGSNDTINGGEGDDRIDGSSGHDVLNGNAGNDIIKGGTGNDTLNGGAGDDLLQGQGSNDTINGGAGIDTIEGSSGHDIISGGAGSDILSGGSGADTYSWLFDDLADGSTIFTDTISDFSSVDILDLSNLDLAGIDDVTLMENNGSTFVSVDIDGTAYDIATLEGRTGLDTQALFDNDLLVI